MSGSAKMAFPFVYMPAFFDSHAHGQSGNCAPLTIMWCKVPGLSQLKPDREKTNAFADIALGKGGRVQESSTIEIMGYLIKSMDEFIGQRYKLEIIGSYVPPPTADTSIPPVSISFPMTMDMEYAWLEGYEGRQVYVYDNENQECTVILHDYDENKILKETKYTLERKEFFLFEKWNKQLSDTKKAALLYPWRLLPCYHYDPRRHNYANRKDIISGIRMLGSDQKKSGIQPSFDQDASPDLSYCTWDYFLAHVAGRKRGNQPGLFPAIKMYTMHGYRPLDPLCGCLWPFYKKCAEDGIPIINHTSPGGNTIPDMPYFREYIRSNASTEPEGNLQFVGQSGLQPDRSKDDDPVVYFKENFVHPRNWRPVLAKYPILKINLAHFGGDEWGKGPEKSDWISEIISLMQQYKNVYTDISCFDLKTNSNHFIAFLKTETGRGLSDRILFGSDWYMILLVLTKWDPLIVASVAAGATTPLAPLEIALSVVTAELMGHGLREGKELAAFCLEMKKMLDTIDWRLWYKFTIVNPFRFYGLDNPILLDNIEAGLQAELQKDKVLKDCEKKKMQDQIADGRVRLNNLCNQIKSLEKQIQ